MSSLFVGQSKSKKRSSSSIQKSKNIEYKMPSKKRNMSTVATNMDSSIAQTQKACCTGSSKSSSKICKDCLSFILNNADIKENMKKTARKTCMSVRSVSKKNTQIKKTVKVKQAKTVNNLSSARKQILNELENISNLDKYTLLKLKQISKKQIISGVRSPIIKTAKKQSTPTKQKKSKDPKKSTRNSILVDATEKNKEEETFQISQINPFGLHQQGRPQSPTFSGQNTQNNHFSINSSFPQEKQQFSFQIKSQKQKEQSHLEKMIDELKDTNEKLKQNLFESYQKYTKSLQTNHEEIKKINQQNSEKSNVLNQQIQTYKIKWMTAESIIQQKEQEKKKILEKNSKDKEDLERKHKQQIILNKKQFSIKIGQMENMLEEQHSQNVKLHEKVKNLEIQNDKLKMINQDNQKKISKLSLDSSKLSIDNEVYMKKLAKMQCQKEFILKNSRTVLDIIQRQIQQGDLKYGETQNNIENQMTSKLQKNLQESSRKNILGQANY